MYVVDVMKKQFVIVLFGLLIAGYTATAQVDGKQRASNTETIIKSYFDDDFPIVKNSKAYDVVPDLQIAYIRSGKYLPSRDAFDVQNEHSKIMIENSNRNQFEIKAWYQTNPYFPQPLTTGNKLEDKKLFLKARSLWIRYNPEAYEQLKLLIYSDDYLREKYAFVVEN